MAVTAFFAESFIEDVFKGIHDLTSDTLKCALINTTGTFDPETDVDWSDISADEIADTGIGYTTGGITLTGVAVAATGTASDGIINITCTNNPTWTASGGEIPTVGAAAIVNTTSATDKIVMFIDFGADYATPDGQIFQVNFSSGVGTATIAVA